MTGAPSSLASKLRTWSAQQPPPLISRTARLVPWKNTSTLSHITSGVSMACCLCVVGTLGYCIGCLALVCETGTNINKQMASLRLRRDMKQAAVSSMCCRKLVLCRKHCVFLLSGSAALLTLLCIDLGYLGCASSEAGHGVAVPAVCVDAETLGVGKHVLQKLGHVLQQTHQAHHT